MKLAHCFRVIDGAVLYSIDMWLADGLGLNLSVTSCIINISSKTKMSWKHSIGIIRLI